MVNIAEPCIFENRWGSHYPHLMNKRARQEKHRHAARRQEREMVYVPNFRAHKMSRADKRNELRCKDRVFDINGKILNPSRLNEWRDLPRVRRRSDMSHPKGHPIRVQG